MRQKAINYAKALYMLYPDGRNLEETKRIYLECPKLKEILSDVSIPQSEKIDFLEKIASHMEEGESKKIFRNLSLLLVKNNEASLILDIFTAYRRFIDEAANIEHLRLYYGKNPGKQESESIKQELSSIFKDKKLIFHENVDESLIGGYRAFTDELIFDKSLRACLEDLREKLKGGL